MQLTAAVINAGLGDLSLGLEMAGFQVAAAFEEDKKAATIHEANIDAPIYHLSVEAINPETLPDIDLLAAHIYLPSYSHAGHSSLIEYENAAEKLQKILSYCNPRAFLLLINTASIKSEGFQYYLTHLANLGYQLSWQMLDVRQMTGFPTRERTACVVGISPIVENRFQFADPNDLPAVPLSKFLESNHFINPWYYCTNTENLPLHKNDQQLMCWKNRVYEGTDLIQWNFMKPPLIRDSNGIRRITHREIANLKGFPPEYDIACPNKQWLYKELIYSNNILVIQQIAGMINYTLSSNPWREQKREREQDFKKLFQNYLERCKEKSSDNSVTIEQDFQLSEQTIDFVLHEGTNTFYFDIKHSLTSKTIKSYIKTISSKVNGTPVLVIANEVSDKIKKEYLEQYGIEIWDVKNLLWSFDEFPDIKNEFIAFLDYSTEHIEPQPTVSEIFQCSSDIEQKELDLKEKLLKIVPGREQFQDYESICIEILKYVLGDYLTLWEIQEPSNNGLYRFDLCCKIKSGINHDFFDTIKHHYNTKYIVFEFKNYRDKITQKEIYTTEKYLYEKALRNVAIIISRSGADHNALLAANGALRETGKLILCLSDNSLLEMIDIKTRGEQEPADFLSAILDDIFLHMEK